jgi:hypothetical protein
MLLSEAENNMNADTMGECVFDLAQSEALCTWKSSLTGTWEISMPPAMERAGWLRREPYGQHVQR